ncbi:MAG: type II glyceraldehyde-3-phosphate dehydrogenase, partial [Halodesulfurarchaeum sp.]
SLPSHHGPDVNTIFPDLDIDTMGLKVPATLMHMHSINVSLDEDPAAGEVRELLDAESRIMLIGQELDIDGTGALKEYALDQGRPRGDLWENGVWAESVTVVDSDLYLFQAIHQESDVVPENIDAIRAVLGEADRETSVARTNEALGIS